MAWSVVQSASVAAPGSGATSNYVQCANALSSGTTVLAAVACSTSTATNISSVTDSSGNAFTLVGRKTQPASPPLADVSLWALATPAAAIGLTKPTFTAAIGSGTGRIAVLVQEVSGIQPAADGTAGVLGGNTTGATGSPSYTSTASSEYLVSVYGDDGGPVTWTRPAGLTADVNSLNGQAEADIAIAYGNSTHGAEAGSWTLAGSAADWGTILVAFRLATAGTGAGLLKVFL